MKNRGWLCVLLLASAATAQRYKLEINAETPEGQLLQQIGQESDAAKKLGFLEEFAAKYSKHEALMWVYAQLQPAYLAANQPDKAMETSEKLLAMDPEAVEAAHGALKAAEGKKDPDLIKKWAVLTSEAARKVVQSKQPEDEDEVEAWKGRVDFSKQVDTYTEYALYASATVAADPKKRLELMDMVGQRNPQSQYLPQLQTLYFHTYRQLGDHAKAVEIAEKVLATDQTNEDMLMVAADYHFTQRGQLKQIDKALAYAGRLEQLMRAKPAPQGVSAEEWEKKKNFSVGYGLHMAGVIHGEQMKYPEADKILREALPLIRANEQLLAEALFHLGVANFRLGDKGSDQAKIIDGLRFSQQCAAIKSRYQANAQRNVNAIRSQYRVTAK